MFDLDLISKVYSELPQKVKKAKERLNRPMTYAEKILYAHLFDDNKLKAHTRGKDYVDFAPDRVAM